MNHKLLLQKLWELHGNMIDVINSYYELAEPDFTDWHGNTWTKPVKPVCQEAIDLYNAANQTKNPALKVQADKVKIQFQSSYEMQKYNMKNILYNYVENEYWMNYSAFYWALIFLIQKKTEVAKYELEIREANLEYPKYERFRDTDYSYKTKEEIIQIYERHVDYVKQIIQILTNKAQ
jgi:hypothetical protein